jgi:hypothetical protein
LAWPCSPSPWASPSSARTGRRRRRRRRRRRMRRRRRRRRRRRVIPQLISGQLISGSEQ